MTKIGIEEIFNRMHCFKDGNETCVVLDDFVDLQESPAYFLYDKQRDRLWPWMDTGTNPLVHLSWFEIINIENVLTDTSGIKCENCLDDPEFPVCTTCGRKWNKQ